MWPSLLSYSCGCQHGQICSDFDLCSYFFCTKVMSMSVRERCLTKVNGIKNKLETSYTGAYCTFLKAAAVPLHLLRRQVWSGENGLGQAIGVSCQIVCVCKQSSLLHFAISGQPHDDALPLCEGSHAAAEEKLELLLLVLDCCWLPRQRKGNPTLLVMLLLCITGGNKNSSRHPHTGPCGHGSFWHWFMHPLPWRHCCLCPDENIAKSWLTLKRQCLSLCELIGAEGTHI